MTQTEETGAEFWREVGPVLKEFRKRAKERRMGRACVLKPEMQRVCKELGISGQVLNNGIHWQFKKDGVVLNFYPTTNKITISGKRIRFTFDKPCFSHRKPIIMVALKELGGIRFAMGKNGAPPIELPKTEEAKERGSLHFSNWTRHSI